MSSSRGRTARPTSRFPVRIDMDVKSEAVETAISIGRQQMNSDDKALTLRLAGNHLQRIKEDVRTKDWGPYDQQELTPPTEINAAVPGVCSLVWTRSGQMGPRTQARRDSLRCR